MKLRFSRVIALITVLVLVLAACSSSDDEGSGDTDAPDATEAPGATEGSDDGASSVMGKGMYGLPAIDPLSVDGSIDVGMAGSSTVFPLSELVLFQWIDDGGPEYTLDSIGSGGGLDRFCGDTGSDIANASRSIKQEEIDLCASNDRTIIEVRVGTDALSLVISNDNDFAGGLTFEQIATAFSLPKGSSWSDVDPSFPDRELQCFSPGADSGTFDFFFETIFPELEEADEAGPMLDSCEIVGEDDNITVEGVAGDSCGTDGGTCGIGYFGYAYYQQNASDLQVVAVDAGEGDGPIVPGVDSVNDGTYPIARPLFMYTADEVVSEKLPVAQFMAYYLNNVNDLISDVGYFPAPDDKLEEAAQNILDAAPGLAG